jgi:CheY-like chemotaxis protein
MVDRRLKHTKMLTFSTKLFSWVRNAAQDAFLSRSSLLTRDSLLDISMPIMDGLESTRAIRAFEQEQNMQPTKIIVLTGVVSASVENEAYASGASLYLTKPVRLKELSSILKQED